LELVPLVGRP
jgi:hypothetical protein